MDELSSKYVYYQSNKGKSFRVGLYKTIKKYLNWVNNDVQLEEKDWKEILDYTNKKVIC